MRHLARRAFLNLSLVNNRLTRNQKRGAGRNSEQSQFRLLICYVIWLYSTNKEYNGEEPNARGALGPTEGFA